MFICRKKAKWLTKLILLVWAMSVKKMLMPSPYVGKIYLAKGNIIHHHRNMPDRPGWTAIKPLEFEQKVEEWED